MKGSKKKTICIFALLFTICAIAYILNFQPKKKAITYDELSNTEYVIVKTVYTSASKWVIIGDHHGYYENPIHTTLVGIYPNVTYNIESGGNTFICYGNFLDDIVTSGGYTNKVFEVNSWDILYPIRHNISVFSSIIPSKYLYPFELK